MPVLAITGHDLPWYARYIWYFARYFKIFINLFHNLSRSL